MAICYRCGRKIVDTHQQLRRRVKTGDWVRRSYGSNSMFRAIRTQYKIKYGMRIVCRYCARSIDISERRGELWAILRLVWPILLLFALILYLELQK